MANRFLVDNLITEVRSLISERNTNGALSDSIDILPILNIAQDRAATILARHYAEPIITNQSVALQTGVSDYTIPEDAFQDGLVKVEINISNGIYREIQRVAYRDSTIYETPNTTAVPLVYCVFGRTYRVLPKASGGYYLRIWYMKDPPKLDIQQGRITTVSEGSNYVRIDALVQDSDGNNYLTTDVNSDNSYVSLIDGQTGQRKGILQIQSITSSTSYAQITFRSSPSRSTIDNQTVSSSLSGLGVTTEDYLCLAPGTCISTLRKPVLNFITSYAAVALQDGVLNGANVGRLEKMSDEFEKDVQALWVNAEQNMRVKAKSSIWGASRRSYWPFPGSRGT